MRTLGDILDWGFAGGGGGGGTALRDDDALAGGLAMVAVMDVGELEEKERVCEHGSEAGANVCGHVDCCDQTPGQRWPY